MCFQGGQPTPTPAHAPLTGAVYVNVGAGNGVAVSYTHDPREHIDAILAHGLRLEIQDVFWANYAADEKGAPAVLCYMYWIYDPLSGTKTWLPEDVLTPDLTAVPRHECFPGRIPPSVYRIAPTPPAGFTVITPEAAPP